MNHEERWRLSGNAAAFYDRYLRLLNLKTAMALGLTIPPSVLVRADRMVT